MVEKKFNFYNIFNIFYKNINKSDFFFNTNYPRYFSCKSLVNAIDYFLLNCFTTFYTIQLRSTNLSEFRLISTIIDRKKKICNTNICNKKIFSIVLYNSLNTHIHNLLTFK
jgi:hypothetical protein